MTKITIYNKQKNLPISIPLYRKAALSLCAFLKINTDELIIHFITNKKMQQLHQLLFNDPSSTDCISVPIDPPRPKIMQKSIDTSHNRTKCAYHLLGEIFVCPKIAKEYALAHAIDTNAEVMRYVVHGLLHLIGFDDLAPKDRKKMKKKEQDCLDFLFKEVYIQEGMAK